MAAIRELLVAFEIDVKDSALGKTSQKLDSLSKKFKAVAGAAALFFGARAIGGFISGTAAAAAAAGDLSEQVGLTAESFQILNLAATLTGATTEDLRITLKSLAKNAQGVVDGNVTMVKAFKDLGIEVKDSNGDLKANDELLLDVGAALAAIKNPTERVAKAQTVLGEASLKLLPLLNGTREELDAYLQSLKDLGGGFSKEAIEASRRFQAALGTLRFFMQGVAGDLIIRLAPAIEGFVDFVLLVSKAVGGVVRSIKEFFGQTKALRNVLGIGLFAAVKKLLPLLLRMGQFVLINPAAAFRPFVAILARIGGLLAIGARFARRFILPFLLLDEIITFFEGGDTLIGRFIDQIAGPGTAKKFQDAIGSFFKGIKAFLTFFFAEDPEAIATAIVEMEQAFNKAGQLFKDFAGTLGAAIITFLVETATLFGEAWDFMLADVIEAFNAWTESISKLITEAWKSLLAGISDMIDIWLGGIAKTFISVFDTVWASIARGARDAFSKVSSFIPEGISSFLGIGGSADGGPVNAGSTGGITSNQNINVQQQINARAGQSPAAIASEANRRQGAVLAAANLRTLRGATQG